MEREEHGGEEQLEEHSLPGTNQAGKEAASCEEKDDKKRSGSATEHQEQLEEHSLPGTNQAGKEASSCEESDERSSGSS